MLNRDRMKETAFDYSDEQFADIQLLRYQLKGFEELTVRQKQLIYYLSEATLWGRDITFDQFGKYNLKIRKTLEAVYVQERAFYVQESASSDEERTDCCDKHQFDALETYLKRVWFSNGIYHHYGCEKFVPEFSEDYFRRVVRTISPDSLPLRDGETVDDLLNEIVPVMFNPELLPKRVNKADGVDLVQTSACNYYDGVTQAEAEAYYRTMKTDDPEPPSYGLNTTLVKENGVIREIVWKADGCYGAAIRQIVYWLEKARDVAESARQQKVIDLLIKYYHTGDLRDFDQYSIEWVRETEGMIDFINGFIEVYGDPLGIKASWEGIVEYKDLEGTRRAKTISDHAQWFEDHSPVDKRFRKPVVKGVVAHVICAAMLGGDEYPSTAIGINLPNADWIRAEYGSKSVTISNLTKAYDEAARGNGFREEFVIDAETLDMLNRWGDVCDDLHTDLHECLGHGSGQLLPGVDPDVLRNYGNTIEEARADLFGLYYIADEKLLELGLLHHPDAYKAAYYAYMMNGLLTQLVRIAPGHLIEEAHMRNRALIARWVLEHSNGAVELVTIEGRGTFVRVNDYPRLRQAFAELLAEIQRIKSEGDFQAARVLVETYAVQIDSQLHKEILQRYQRLHLAPYKGFINPVMRPVYDGDKMVDVKLDYSESYTDQMLRYSRDYSAL